MGIDEHLDPWFQPSQTKRHAASLHLFSFASRPRSSHNDFHSERLALPNGQDRTPSMHYIRFVLLLSVVFIPAAVVRADESADFRPDPRSVQWYGPAYRYPQEGWVVLHIEGEPYERGY